MDHEALRRRELPPAFREHALAALAEGFVPVAPRHAATVALLRDAERHGVEVYLLRRLTSMTFAGGMYVFPGGSVDPQDADALSDWSGPEPADWATVLDAPEPLARGLVAAAVRETFEESGVQLRPDLLRPWAHWVTPEFEPKRFDTRFFVAALPEGQTAVHSRGESDRSEWLRPADALAKHATGEMGMLPPTVLTLAELAEYGSVTEVLVAAQARDLRRMLPKVVVTGEAVTLLLPGEEGYPDE